MLLKLLTTGISSAGRGVSNVLQRRAKVDRNKLLPQKKYYSKDEPSVLGGLPIIPIPQQKKNLGMSDEDSSTINSKGIKNSHFDNIMNDIAGTITSIHGFISQQGKDREKFWEKQLADLRKSDLLQTESDIEGKGKKKGIIPTVKGWLSPMMNIDKLRKWWDTVVFGSVMMFLVENLQRIFNWVKIFLNNLNKSSKMIQSIMDFMVDLGKKLGAIKLDDMDQSEMEKELKTAGENLDKAETDINNALKGKGKGKKIKEDTGTGDEDTGTGDEDTGTGDKNSLSERLFPTSERDSAQQGSDTINKMFGHEPEEEVMDTFSAGGMIRGPSHSQGGVNINAEGGEVMMSKRAVNFFGASTLLAMNALGGGNNIPSMVGGVQMVENGGVILNPSAMKAWKETVNAAKKDDIDLPSAVTSSYRTVKEQQELIDRAAAGDPNVMTPAPVGMSPHGQGWAVDLDYYSRANEWMRKNGPKYGWRWQGETDPVHFDFMNNEPNDKWLRPGNRGWIPGEEMQIDKKDNVDTLTPLPEDDSGEMIIPLPPPPLPDVSSAGGESIPIMLGQSMESLLNRYYEDKVKAHMWRV